MTDVQFLLPKKTPDERLNLDEDTLSALLSAYSSLLLRRNNLHLLGCFYFFFLTKKNKNGPDQENCQGSGSLKEKNSILLIV